MAYSDTAFPTSLHQCADAPLVLFCSGQPFPNTTRIISIVGTRQLSESRKTFVRQLPQPKLFIELNEKEKSVISHMSGTPKHIDLIALDAKLKVSEIASILFQLELKVP